MRVPVWLIIRPGEEPCATARTISPERREALVRDGYDILLAYLELPPRYSQETATAKVRMQRSGTGGST